MKNWLKRKKDNRTKNSMSFTFIDVDGELIGYLILWLISLIALIGSFLK